MNIYDFRIAGLRIRIETEWPVRMSDNYVPFLCSGEEPWEETIRITASDDAPEAWTQLPWHHNSAEIPLKNGEKCIFHRLTACSPPHSAEIIEGEKERTFCFFRQQNQLPYTILQVFNNISVEQLLLRHGILILHCSLIRRKGEAILFSAPSGTGKSTQAALWQQFMGAEILNGDRAALRETERGWNAWGIPMAGSSGIYRNESAPVSALVVLKQGPENAIRRLPVIEAMGKLYPETSLFREDREWVQKILDLLMDLLHTVPVWLLSCRPDREAVELLHGTLKNEVENL